MPGARQWLGGLLLRAPAPLRALREIPILGGLIHRVSHRLVPSDEKVWAQVEGGPAKGLWMELNPRTGAHYLRGDGEAPTQELLKKRLKPGMVFYDLGANVGLFSILAARLVGPAGKVVSFEPDPETAARLRRNLARNGFHNATVIQAGVWSSSGKQNFMAADASSPDHGVGRFEAESGGAAGTDVECVALDDFVASGPAPDAIKCDVEGAEVEVLRGAAGLLQSRHPWIVCELHSESNAQRVKEILTEAGYRVESVDSNHIVAVPKQAL
ncbi:MAG: FkbM family methyltransferase [Candidatus Acidiferrales bacterium]